MLATPVTNVKRNRDYISNLPVQPSVVVAGAAGLADSALEGWAAAGAADRTQTADAGQTKCRNKDGPPTRRSRSVYKLEYSRLCGDFATCEFPGEGSLVAAAGKT
jgi:hypothetical protein